MDKTALKKHHEQFVKQSNDLAKTAKDKIFTQIMSQLDITEIIDNPVQAKSDIKQLFIEAFSPYFQDAVRIGRTFGQEKIKLINHA
jgi:hypothetical protein